VCSVCWPSCAPCCSLARGDSHACAACVEPGGYCLAGTTGEAGSGVGGDDCDCAVAVSVCRRRWPSCFCARRPTHDSTACVEPGGDCLAGIREGIRSTHGRHWKWTGCPKSVGAVPTRRRQPRLRRAGTAWRCCCVESTRAAPSDAATAPIGTEKNHRKPLSRHAFLEEPAFRGFLPAHRQISH